MDGRIKAYQTTDTLGNSQIELILKVYDGAISSYRQAIQYYSDDKLTDGYEQLERSKKFVTHLYTTLDANNGGKVAENLGKLYAFVINQTNVAESTKDSTILESNIEILQNLRSGWISIKDQDVTSARQQDNANAVTANSLVTSG